MRYIWTLSFANTHGASNGLLQRLTARQCEYCRSTDGKFEAHHVRKLSDIKNGKEKWQIIMTARRRKTLILCMSCHHLLHVISQKTPKYLIHLSGWRGIFLLQIYS
jgi:hypothetical protein